jgi:hypothetical protein
LWSDQPKYNPGSRVQLFARIASSHSRPCNSYYVVAHYIPDKDPSRMLSTVLTPISCASIPMKVMKFLTCLNAVSDEAWRMVERADKEGDNRAKLRALYLAQETTLQTVDVITNSKMLIDEAFKNPIQNQI